jgi:hypothetical protein
MEHTQVLRIKKLKGGGIIATAARHNLREIQAEIGADSHIDPLKTSQNVVLRGAGRASDVAAAAVKLMEQAKLKKPLQKNGVHGLEILCSLPSSSGIAAVDYFADAVAWAEMFFEIPILSAVIHNDEATPHCHVIMLPLFDGRMIGSALVGNRTRLLAMQADFHAKVAQGYGLKRGEPAKHYSGAARLLAADRVVTALRGAKSGLDDPAIRDALRDAIAETMPVHLMELLGLDMPEVRTPKPKTYIDILIQNKPERKLKKPIGNADTTKPIGFATVADDQKVQSLSCVGFANSSPLIQPADTPQSSNQDEYVREREEDHSAGSWDSETGEYIRPSTTTKRPQVKVETMRSALAGIAARKRSDDVRT